MFGWNTRDNLVGMDPRFARVLENMVVQGGSLCTRKGYTLAAAVKKRIIPRMSQGMYFSFGVSGTTNNSEAKNLGYDVFFEQSKNLA